jgi:hypothetical protein
MIRTIVKVENSDMDGCEFEIDKTILVLGEDSSDLMFNLRSVRGDGLQDGKVGRSPTVG